MIDWNDNCFGLIFGGRLSRRFCEKVEEVRWSLRSSAFFKMRGRIRLGYQPLFGKMSPHWSPERALFAEDRRPHPGDGGNQAWGRICQQTCDGVWHSYTKLTLSTDLVVARARKLKETRKLENRWHKCGQYLPSASRLDIFLSDYAFAGFIVCLSRICWIYFL